MSANPPGHLMHPDLTPDWCDPVAVHRALNGLPVGRPLHRAEQHAVARTAHRRGDSNTVLGRMLGCSTDVARLIRQEATCSD